MMPKRFSRNIIRAISKIMWINLPPILSKNPASQTTTSTTIMIYNQSIYFTPFHLTIYLIILILPLFELALPEDFRTLDCKQTNEKL